MAFPQIASTATSISATSVASHTMDMPSGTVAGDLVLVYFAYNNGTATGAITFPAGWTQFRPADNNGTNHGLAYAYHIADGTEGSSITVLTAVACKGVFYAQRFTGARATSPVQAGAVVSATTTTPNPPSLILLDSADYTWQAITAYDLSTGAGITVSAYPASYSGGVNPTGAATDSAAMGVASRELAADNEDPGTFTISASEQTITNLIVIRPATAADTDLAALNARVAAALNDPAYGYWSSAYIDSLVEDEVRLLYPRFAHAIDPNHTTSARITAVEDTGWYELPTGMIDIQRVDWYDSDDAFVMPLPAGTWEVFTGTDGTSLYVNTAYATDGYTFRLTGHARYDTVTNLVPAELVSLVVARCVVRAYRRTLADRMNFRQWATQNQVQNVSMNEMLQVVRDSEEEARRLYAQTPRTWRKPVPGRV